MRSLAGSFSSTVFIIPRTELTVSSLALRFPAAFFIGTKSGLSGSLFDVSSFSETSEAPLDLFWVFSFSFVDAGQVEGSTDKSGLQKSLDFISGNRWSNQVPYPLSS